MEIEVVSAGKATTPLVSGQIIIVAETPAFAGATLHVYLEDVSYADAEAVAVAESSVADVQHTSFRSGSTTVPFALYLTSYSDVIDARHDYAVRVWVDCDSDGKPGRNDLFSDQTYRVLTRGFANEVTITLGPPARSVVP